MKRALQDIGAQLVNVALMVLFIAVWLGLGAYLDGKPTEADAAQATADDFHDAITAARVAARDARRPFPTTAESQP